MGQYFIVKQLENPWSGTKVDVCWRKSKQTLTDDLKNIDKAIQNMKADNAKHDRLAKEMIKGTTAELGAGVRAAV